MPCFLSVSVPAFFINSLVLSYWLSASIHLVFCVVFSCCICSSVLSSPAIHCLYSYSGRFICYMVIMYGPYVPVFRQAQIPCSFLNPLRIVMVVILKEISPVYLILFFVYFIRICNAWILSLRFILPEYYRRHFWWSVSSHSLTDVSISYFHVLTA
jgi:hypothetical protein